MNTIQVENMRSLTKKEILLMFEQNLNIDELKQIKLNKKTISQKNYLKSDAGKLANKLAGLKMKYHKDPILLQKTLERVLENPFVLEILLQKLSLNGKIAVLDKQTF